MTHNSMGDSGVLAAKVDGPEQFDPKGHRAQAENMVVDARAAKLQRFDWTVIPTPPGIGLTPFQQSIHNVDWNKSALGPMQNWPIQLRQMVMLVVADPSPAVIYWDNEEGVENAIVYNEAYIQLIGQKHPSLQGADPKVGFAEVWDSFVPILEKGRRNFEVDLVGNQMLLLSRHGFFEECYFSWKFVPIVGPKGYVVGSHATVVESTREVLLERRLGTIRSVDIETSASNDATEVWSGLIRGMEPNIKDVPLTMIYSTGTFSGDSTPDKTPSPALNICRLEGILGSESLSEMAPQLVDLDGDDFLAQSFRAVIQGNRSIIFSIEEGTLPADLSDGFGSREEGVVCNSLIVSPIWSSSSQSVLGFLILGINPRRPLDTDYRDFIDILAQQMSTIVNRLRLSEDLSLKTHEHKQSEIKFTRFASHAPLGLAVFSPTGRLDYANDFWYKLTQVSKTKDDLYPWDNSDMALDNHIVSDQWDIMIATKKPVNFKVALRTKWSVISPEASHHDGTITVLCMAFPELDEAGNLISVMSCLTDVSELNWVEDQLRSRTGDLELKIHDVLEMKRQQENFIDMTSHEIRNPLSAMLHCAEEIFTSLEEVVNGTAKYDDSVLKASMEAAETITYCVLHQKRIVDDILVLSRLDTQLLQVTPVATQPRELIHQSLKMFEAEAKTSEIDLNFECDSTLDDLHVKYLMFDPNRVIQVLVNLVGNALKFTRTQEIRQITVLMHASLDKPSESMNGLEFIPTRMFSTEKQPPIDCGTGEVIYLSLTVTDTGRGLTPEEKKTLFQRFSQASPKTHTKYGGSGLGLFISKQLTELHGGKIGVESESGKGSSFFFYVETRRTDERSSVRPDLGRRVTSSLQAEVDVRAAAGGEPKGLRHNHPGLTHTLSGTEIEHKKSSEGEELTILVVEDNLLNQKVVVKQLQKAGCVVHVANNGLEALQFLERTTFWRHEDEGNHQGSLSEHPVSPPSLSPLMRSKSNEQRPVPIPLSVILMDLEMPVMDGIACIRRIRALEAEGKIKARIPTIAVTANARNEQLEDAMRAGMDGSVTKPYRIPDMMRTIGELAVRGEPLSKVKDEKMTG